ncbi:hypothetical protein SAMN05216378_5528 [Paenibacillus catalpae]|uniref:Uncharacterized protein n=1 Tax=Paenibacillus catalpae TaxID=1045775 RepID=A0A1I2GZE9_9BACL|nr:hypothetical protein [Paenibacillus catalpae]SFF21956.1 hypothetical protein SAMN05216378_5528 [Paenibacillus catalpae]
MLELQDLIPYFFSISILCSMAYLAYFAHQSVDVEFSTVQKRFIWEPIVPLVVITSRLDKIQHWLARRIKRKEAPDGDSADCHSSFVKVTEHAHKRGGYYEQKQCIHRFF